MYNDKFFSGFKHTVSMRKAMVKVLGESIEFS
jgi:hypothetical protein